MEKPKRAVLGNVRANGGSRPVASRESVPVSRAENVSMHTGKQNQFSQIQQSYSEYSSPPDQIHTHAAASQEALSFAKKVDSYNNHASVKSGRRKMVFAFAGLICLGLIVGGYIFYSKQQAVLPPEVASKVEFKPIAPSKEQVQGASYDDSKKVLSYTTKVGDTEASFSQQPLPEKLKTEDGVKDFLAQYRITKIQIKKGSAYLAKPGVDGQAVILLTSDSLIFIKAVKEVDQRTWVDYLNTL